MNEMFYFLEQSVNVSGSKHASEFKFSRLVHLTSIDISLSFDDLLKKCYVWIMDSLSQKLKSCVSVEIMHKTLLSCFNIF